jgi:hypothetical protein
MYEMGGLAPTSPHQARPVAWLCYRGAPPAGARHPCAGPVSRLLPRSQGRPQVVPVSSGESIFTASANAAQEPEANYFRFFRYPHGIHKRQSVIRTCRWLSTGLFTLRPQAIWRSSGIPAPTVAARNRLILPSLFRVITHMATRELWFRHLQYPWHYDSHIWRCSAYPAGLSSSPGPSSAWLGERRHAGGR